MAKSGHGPILDLNGAPGQRIVRTWLDALSRRWAVTNYVKQGMNFDPVEPGHQWIIWMSIIRSSSPLHMRLACERSFILVQKLLLARVESLNRSISLLSFSHLLLGSFQCRLLSPAHFSFDVVLQLWLVGVLTVLIIGLAGILHGDLPIACEVAFLLHFALSLIDCMLLRNIWID